MIDNRVAERLFQAGAGVLMLVAAYFLWNGDYERVFVVAALGSLSFFISIRFQVKERLEIRAAEKEQEELAGTEVAGDAESGLETEPLEEARR